jgi:hypothetical protein
VTVYAMFLCTSVYYCPMMPELPAHPSSPYYASREECEATARSEFGADALRLYKCMSKRVDVWQ